MSTLWKIKIGLVCFWLIIPLALLLINFVDTIGLIAMYLGGFLLIVFALLPLGMMLCSLIQIISDDHKNKLILALEFFVPIISYVWFFLYQGELHMGNIFFLAGGVYAGMVLYLILTFFENKKGMV